MNKGNGIYVVDAELYQSITNQIYKAQNDPLLQEFTKKFYSYIPDRYLSNDYTNLFIKIVSDVFVFFKHRMLADKKVEVLSYNNDSIYGSCITIKLINDDKSFLIDSLEILLSQLKLKHKFLFHPILHSARNQHGEFLGFSNESSIQESVIYIQIEGYYDQSFVDDLKSKISDLLDLVDIVYKSWLPIVSKLDAVVDKIESNDEIHHFLKWLKANHFTFLGYVELDSNGDILDSLGDLELCDISRKIKHNKDAKVILGQINKISKVHRKSFVDYVKIHVDDKAYIFLGLYSAAIYHQSASTIPIIREKVKYVLDNSGFVQSGYNIKKLKAILEYLPREVLIQNDRQHLAFIAIKILSAMMTKSLKVFCHKCSAGEFVNILIFMPRDRLTPQVYSRVKVYLRNVFNTDVLDDYTMDVQQNFSYLYISLAANPNISEGLNLNSLEEQLDIISSRWEDSVIKELNLKYEEVDVQKFIPYVDFFTEDYKQKFQTSDVIADIEYIEQLQNTNKTAFNLTIIDNINYSLKIYSKENEALSDLLPLIENLGFKVIDEQTFDLKIEKSDLWIYAFNLKAEYISEPNKIHHNVAEALERMQSKELESDSLCKLITLAGFNWRQVFVIKALTRYLHQTNFAYGKGYVQLTLVNHYKYVKLLFGLFESRLHPMKRSEINEDKYRKDLNTYLSSITSSAEDKVLRSMLLLCVSIVRTNCYSDKDYISFKFNSSLVPGLPNPVPYAEIFVYGKNFEGIHLRGGKVARGGLRWSDRGEDYRTEVLGLMKAQMTKNAVIVPVGSKGGFFIKTAQNKLSRAEYMEIVIECYKTFLRGLLDLTDNIVKGKIVQPDIVIYDEEDPYLVVAADKGTATFSDYANAVSKEYNFWLGDAFASGGSAGYDHKKMAITAKGAWISVTNHFASMNIDVQKDHIRVLGIGDMSGDVFGNGMLLSRSIKLVAAFNHMHIFIDPSPDPDVSFNERERLFKLPTSSWADYNNSLISKGGGIFERSVKTIQLTDEMRVLLNVKDLEIEPDLFIKMLLKSDVDLIWNGGIGTYMKASDEAHIDIGDKTNDALRVSAKDVRAKVIGEGGNLGCSQRGRIEYAKNGGYINTDFIDNSAGVDCSDHEVNIKILMNHAISGGKLTIEHRNEFLASMQKEVSELVLEDNFKQTEALTINEKSSAFTVEMFSRVISSLEDEGLLNREVEFLPSEAELSRRSVSGEKMTRPELAVLLSYSKMSLYNELLRSSIPDDKYCESYLFNYFPQLMHQEFKQEILSHYLRREIITTVVTNKIVNQLSGPIISNIHRETGAKLCDIVRSYLIVTAIFDLDDIWEKVEALPSNISMDLKVEMFTDLGKIMRRGIAWFLRNLDHPINIENTISNYQKPAIILRDSLGQFLLGDAKEKFEAKVTRYVDHDISHQFASSLAILDSLVSVFDILFVAKDAHANDSEVAKTYFEVGELFSLDWLRKCSEKQIDDSYWNRLSIQALKDDLYDKQRRILQQIIKDKNVKMDVSLWYQSNKKESEIFTDFIADLKESSDAITLNIVLIANKKLEMFLRKI